MLKLPRISSRKLISILLKMGFYIHPQRGSHLNLKHPIKIYLHVVVPVNKETLAPKTFKTILTQAEIDLEEFKKFI